MDKKLSSKKPFSDTSVDTHILYHCLYKEPEGDQLIPTCEREVNGRSDKFLFAATHLSKALAFAFSYHF